MLSVELTLWCVVDPKVCKFANVHGWGMSHTCHKSLSKTILKAALKVGDVLSAEEMLDGQCQRVDVPASARTAHKGLLQKRLEEDLC